MNRATKVSDYMTRDLVTASLTDGLRQTFYRMRERDIRHMPVVDEREQLVGIISDRDLRRPDWVDDEENVAHYYVLDNAHKVKDSMTGDPACVSPEDDVRRAAGVIVEKRVGALPVVDAGGKLVGMISAIDLLRALQEA